jgi:hypothetical protein
LHNLARYQTRGPEVQKWMFLLVVHGKFIFHLILMGEDNPRTISAKFGVIWFSGFRGEDLYVKFYDV